MIMFDGKFTNNKAIGCSADSLTSLVKEWWSLDNVAYLHLLSNPAMHSVLFLSNCGCFEV